MAKGRGRKGRKKRKREEREKIEGKEENWLFSYPVSNYPGYDR